MKMASCDAWDDLPTIGDRYTTIAVVDTAPTTLSISKMDW